MPNYRTGNEASRMTLNFGYEKRSDRMHAFNLMNPHSLYFVLVRVTSWIVSAPETTIHETTRNNTKRRKMSGSIRLLRFSCETLRSRFSKMQLSFHLHNGGCSPTLACQ